MSDNEEEPQVASKSQVTLTQMLNALDKDVAVGLGKRIKKLSKKAVIKAPLDENKAKLLARRTAYSQVTKDLAEWDPILDKRKQEKQLKFPLYEEPSVLPSASEIVSELKPINDFERKIQDIVQSDDRVLHDRDEFSKAEQKYLKAIDSEEAKARHLELQRTRVLLSCYAAKMRRQKAIKSKSYRRLMKHERLKKHMKMVESNKDNFIEEVEKLKKLRAQERASLKHKNTGKWAKHAKFRAKYDEQARQAMIEQLGISEKLRSKPDDTDESSGSSSETDEDDDDESLVSAAERSDEEGSIDDDEIERRLNAIREEDRQIASNDKTSEQTLQADRLIISSDLISNRAGKKMRRKVGTSELIDAGSDGQDSDEGSDNEDVEDDDEEVQHRLMSEAFADDDVVKEFKKAKEDLAKEEQPKDVNLFLPGWNDWTGPGIKINKRKQKKYIIRAKKRPRQDDKLGNVIISEDAKSKISPLDAKKLPPNLRTGNRFERMIQKPVTGTFAPQLEHREAIKPKVQIKMGARIEPMSKERTLRSKVKFV